MSTVGPSPKIKIYVCHRMTGRYKDELCAEERLTRQALEAQGFIVLDPIAAEGVADVHELLDGATNLESHWKRDKAMIREADLILDYETMGRSDGANKEVGYTRYCLWKPVVRVWSGPGGSISRLEDDVIVPTLAEAVAIIEERYGSYEKLGAWRSEIWDRCFIPWLNEQRKINQRYDLGTVSRSGTEVRSM